MRAGLLECHLLLQTVADAPVAPGLRGDQLELGGELERGAIMVDGFAMLAHVRAVVAEAKVRAHDPFALANLLVDLERAPRKIGRSAHAPGDMLELAAKLQRVRGDVSPTVLERLIAGAVGQLDPLFGAPRVDQRAPADELAFEALLEHRRAYLVAGLVEQVDHLAGGDLIAGQ